MASRAVQICNEFMRPNCTDTECQVKQYLHSSSMGSPVAFAIVQLTLDYDRLNTKIFSATC